MDLDSIKIRIPGHYSDESRRCQEWRKKEVNFDFHICTAREDNVLMPAHKSVLTKWSPPLRKVTEKYPDAFGMDLNGEELRDVLDLLYDGEISVSSEYFQENFFWVTLLLKFDRLEIIQDNEKKVRSQVDVHDDDDGHGDAQNDDDNTESKEVERLNYENSRLNSENSRLMSQVAELQAKLDEARSQLRGAVRGESGADYEVTDGDLDEVVEMNNNQNIEKGSDGGGGASATNDDVEKPTFRKSKKPRKDGSYNDIAHYEGIDFHICYNPGGEQVATWRCKNVHKGCGRKIVLNNDKNVVEKIGHHKEVCKKKMTGKNKV